MTIRNIRQVIEPKIVIEGAGVRLRRSISPHRTNIFDPFLLFDHFIFDYPIEGPISGFRCIHLVALKQSHICLLGPLIIAIVSETLEQLVRETYNG